MKVCAGLVGLALRRGRAAALSASNEELIVFAIHSVRALTAGLRGVITRWVGRRTQPCNFYLQVTRVLGAI